MKENTKNPTCLVTGRNDDLRMHAIRDDNENMIGWMFLHSTIDPVKIAANITWQINAIIKTPKSDD